MFLFEFHRLSEINLQNIRNISQKVKLLSDILEQGASGKQMN